jgi:hypothetical protein
MSKNATHWARRDNRWDVYPQAEKEFRVCVEPDGPFSRIYNADTGHEIRSGVILTRKVSS